MGRRVDRRSVLVAAAVFLAVPTGVAGAEPAEEAIRLDVGAYPTTPAAPLGIAGSPQAGAAAEGRRMADFVVGPWEVDPRLTGLFDTSAVVIDGPDAAQPLFPVELGEVASRHRVISGFSTARWADDIELQHTVLRFADPAVAAAAARDFADALAHRTVPFGPIVGAAIPGHPQTSAFSNPVIEEDSGRPVTFVRSITAHGPYVLSERAVAADGVDTAAALIAGALDRQLPLIDQFTLTPLWQLAALPVDPSGLMARTVPLPPDEVTATLPGSYGPHATLHFQDDPTRSAPVLAASGLANSAYAGAGVYETRDPRAAADLVPGLVAEYLETGTDAGPIEGLPSSRCVTAVLPDSDEQTGYCVAAVDRYVAEGSGDTVEEARQRVAAQYLMLTR